MGTTPTRATTLADYQARILRVLVYIQRHLNEEISLEDLARVASFSPYHFHRIFRGQVGESVREHVRRIRLERAASRLMFTDGPVVTIALEAGYESHEAFSRAFKSRFGLTPSAFRATRSEDRSACRASVAAYDEDGPPAIFPKPEGAMRMDATLVRREATRVAFVRHTGPYQQCGDAWETLCTHLGRLGHLGGDTEYVGLSYDDPEVTPPDRVRYDACCTVDDRFQPEGSIGVQTLPAGDYAKTTHFGPFEKLSETYGALLGRFIPGHDRRPASTPCLEVYLTDPETTEPDDYVTDVYVPLEPV